MKRIIGFCVTIILVAAVISGTALILLFGLGIQTDEASFIAGFVLAFGGVLIADESIPLFFDEEWGDEDEDE